MLQDRVAPWAELVPDAAETMTAEQLARLPDEDGWLHELVEGRLVRMPSPGGEHGVIAFRFGFAMGMFVEAHQLGAITAAETGFSLANPGAPDTVLGADAAFVRTDRIPTRGSNAWPAHWALAPDLVVEVASPSQYRPEMHAKARRWLAAGVRLLWLVWPSPQEVEVWRPGSHQPIAILGLTDSLNGLDVLPGFSYPLARLLA